MKLSSTAVITRMHTVCMPLKHHNIPSSDVYVRERKASCPETGVEHQMSLHRLVLTSSSAFAFDFASDFLRSAGAAGVVGGAHVQHGAEAV